MYGKDVNTLSVYLQVDDQRGQPVWTLSGDQGFLSFTIKVDNCEEYCLGDVWLRGEYSIPKTNSSLFQIVFEGVSGA